MASRCKFYCESVEKRWEEHTKRFLYTYKFSAVYRGSPENEQFFAYTPSGTLSVGMVRADAFESGKEYFLDISLVEA